MFLAFCPQSQRTDDVTGAAGFFVASCLASRTPLELGAGRRCAHSRGGPCLTPNGGLSFESLDHPNGWCFSWFPIPTKTRVPQCQAVPSQKKANPSLCLHMPRVSWSIQEGVKQTSLGASSQGTWTLKLQSRATTSCPKKKGI